MFKWNDRWFSLAVKSQLYCVSTTDSIQHVVALCNYQKCSILIRQISHCRKFCIRGELGTFQVFEENAHWNLGVG